MKHFFLILIAYAFFNINAKAQSNNLVASIHHLKANIENGQLYMSWHTAGTNMDLNFEVQASSDAEHYSTIGYVLGTDVKGRRGGYTFKQQIAKMKPGMLHFRVLQEQTIHIANASEAIGITK